MVGKEQESLIIYKIWVKRKDTQLVTTVVYHQHIDKDCSHLLMSDIMCVCVAVFREVCCDCHCVTYVFTCTDVLLHWCFFAMKFLPKKINKVTDWIEYIGIYVFTEDIKSMKHVYHPSWHAGKDVSSKWASLPCPAAKRLGHTVVVFFFSLSLTFIFFYFRL